MPQFGIAIPVITSENRIRPRWARTSMHPMKQRKNLIRLAAAVMLVTLCAAALFVSLRVARQGALEAFERGHAAMRAGDPQAALQSYEEAFHGWTSLPEAGFALFDERILFDPPGASAVLARLESRAAQTEAFLARQVEADLALGSMEDARLRIRQLDQLGATGFNARHARLLMLFAEQDYPATPP
jgi:hypothetical protein